MLRQRGVVIVSRRVLQQALCLLRRAMTAFSTEVQPPLPVQSMIGLGLAANLVGETKAPFTGKERSDSFIESGLVLDVMQTYRADYDIDRSIGKIEPLG